MNLVRISGVRISDLPQDFVIALTIYVTWSVWLEFFVLSIGLARLILGKVEVYNSQWNMAYTNKVTISGDLQFHCSLCYNSCKQERLVMNKIFGKISLIGRCSQKSFSSAKKARQAVPWATGTFVDTFSLIWTRGTSLSFPLQTFCVAAISRRRTIDVRKENPTRFWVAPFFWSRATDATFTLTLSVPLVHCRTSFDWGR